LNPFWIQTGTNIIDTGQKISEKEGFIIAGKMTKKLTTLISIKRAERSEAKSAKRSFASKIKIRDILTRSFASRFLLRFAQLF